LFSPVIRATRAATCSIFFHCAPTMVNELQKGEKNF
jgi:hypothetical protein